MAPKLHFHHPRPLQVKLNPDGAVFTGMDSEPLKGKEIEWEPIDDSEKIILDALEIEYDYRMMFRFKTVILVVFLAFLATFYAMIYTRFSTKDLYQMNNSIRSLLSMDPPENFPITLPDIDALYDWLNNTVIQEIWKDPQCNNGICSAPSELPKGIFMHQGCETDCGNLEFVTFHVRLFEGKTNNFTYDFLHNVSMCWKLTTFQFFDAIEPTSEAGCVEPVEKKIISNCNKTAELEFKFVLSQGPIVDWFFHVPFADINAFINMTIDGRIVRIYGSPKGFNYVDNSLANFWIWNQNNMAFVIGNNFVNSDFCLSHGLKNSSASWPFHTDVPAFLSSRSCVGIPQKKISFHVVNPALLYLTLNRPLATEHFLDLNDPLSTNNPVGVFMQLTHKPCSERICWIREILENESQGRYTYSQKNEFPSTCNKHFCDATNEKYYGRDPIFLPNSSIYNPKLRVSDYYFENETIDGIPYGFFDTTDSFIKDFGKAYFVLIPSSLDPHRAHYLFTFLKEGGFIDPNSHYMSVEYVVINVKMLVFMRHQYDILFRSSSAISVDRRIDFLLLSWRDNSKRAFWIFVVFLFVVLAYDKFVLLDTLFPNFRNTMLVKKLFPLNYNVFSKRTNGFDYLRCCWPDLITDIMFLISLVIIRIMDKEIAMKSCNGSGVQLYKNVHNAEARILQLAKENIHDDKNVQFFTCLKDIRFLLCLKTSLFFLFGINTLLLFIRTLKLCHYHHRFGIMSRSIINIWPELMAIGFLWVLVTVPYALIGVIAFGDELKEFNSFTEAFQTLFKIVLSELDVYEKIFTSVDEVTKLFYLIYFWTYVIIGYVILINFVVATIVEAFSRLKEMTYLHSDGVIWPNDLKFLKEPKMLYSFCLFYLVIKNHKIESLGINELSVFHNTYRFFIHKIIWLKKKFFSNGASGVGHRSEDNRNNNYIYDDDDNNNNDTGNICHGNNATDDYDRNHKFECDANSINYLYVNEPKIMVVKGRQIHNFVLHTLFYKRLVKAMDMFEIDDDDVVSLVRFVLNYYGAVKEKSSNGDYGE